MRRVSGIVWCHVARSCGHLGLREMKSNWRRRGGTSHWGALWGWYGVSRGMSQKRKQRLHLPDWMQIGLCPSCLHSKQGGLLQDRSNSETVPLPQCSTEPELAPCPELGIWWLGLSQLALQLSSFEDGLFCPGLLRRRQERRCAPAGSPGAMSCL